MSTLKTTNIAHPSATGTNIVLNSDDSTTLGIAKLTTLADSAGSNTSTPAAIANGIAKAWVNFNGTGTVAIRASYNVSSITDTAVGSYDVNFINAISSDSCVVASCSLPTTYHNSAEIYNPLTTKVTVFTQSRGASSTGGSVATDMSLVTVAVFR